MQRIVFPAVLCVFSFAGALAQDAHYQKHGPALLPDTSVTKGAVRLKSTSIICAIKWGKDERHVTQSMKNTVFAAYGTRQGEGVCAFKEHIGTKGQTVREACEIDHLISRELGGADTTDNLWPQPYTEHPGAREKDWLENRMNKEVCHGDITLEAAQQEIKTDWYAAYLKRKPH